MQFRFSKILVLVKEKRKNFRRQAKEKGKLKNLPFSFGYALISRSRNCLFRANNKKFGSAGKTRTYNPSVTPSPKLSFEGGLSHQLFFSQKSCRTL